MDVEFQNPQLAELEAAGEGGLPSGVARAYRKRIMAIRAAVDERDLYMTKSNRFKKMEGGRSHQHSMRLNDKWRLILEVVKGKPKNTIIVVAIEDYH